MKLSLSQAAKEAKKSKATISKDIKNGKLSANKVDNRFEIDPAELFRVYPKETAETGSEPDAVTVIEQVVNGEKDKEIAMLRELLEAKDKHIESVERQIGVLNQKLLTAPADEQQKGLWKRIFG